MTTPSGRDEAGSCLPQSSRPSSHSALILLTAAEQQIFFGGIDGGVERLRQLLPDAVWIDPKREGKKANACLQESLPRILVSGWSTPALTAEVGGLDYVCHLGGSVRNLVPRCLIADGLMVSNWGQAISETVAEAALMLTLSALRRSHDFASLMHVRKGWTYFPSGGLSLFDRRVGIHGFGSVARNLVPLLRPFRPQIAAFSPGIPDADFAQYGVSVCRSIEELFARSDVLIELEALTPATRGIVTRQLLELLPPEASFVNVGRGPVVDESALIDLAAKGRLRLALDVFSQEPLAVDSPLRGMADVTLFPHIAGPTMDRSHLCGELALANLDRFLKGEPVEALVSLEIYDRST